MTDCELDIDEEAAKNAEAMFFDCSAARRTAQGQIPLEADIRRATRFVPTRPGHEPIDPRMMHLLNGRYRQRFIKSIAHQDDGRVLDIGCGPGWLALELGRRGQIVEGYDLSSKAIGIANRMLAENPFKEGFGQVTYHLGDITEVDLGSETYDAISGWSSFHHLSNLSEFMERVYTALKPGGVVATFDDLEAGKSGRVFRWAAKLLLPTYGRGYIDKTRRALRILRGIEEVPEEVFSPMEVVAEKHTTAAKDIERIWRDKFELVWSVQFDVFATDVCMSLAGPDWFRYPAAKAIVAFDRFLSASRLCAGSYRIQVARKREHPGVRR